MHNAVRGHPDAYEQATEGLGRVVTERGICPSPILQVSCTISAHTQAHLNTHGAPHFEDQCCEAVYRELWVLPNGNVGACVHIPELCMGNIQQGSLMATWNSPRYRRFRQYVGSGLLPVCGRCEKLRYERHPR